MIRRLTTAFFALLIALPVAAQAPAGWLERVDASTDAADPDDVPNVTVRSIANGFEVVTGPAIALWNPANTATGNYTLEGTFTLLQPSGHVNYYGLIYGGSGLEGASQSYIYFLVGQNGSFIIRHRANNDTVHDILGRTVNAAVTTQPAARPGPLARGPAGGRRSPGTRTPSPARGARTGPPAAPPPTSRARARPP